MLQELPSVDEITSFLSQVPLFRNVQPKFQQAIAQRLENRSFDKGEIIFTEGDAGDALYVVRSGSVGVFIVEAMVGLQFELARLRAGQVFGEMAVLTAAPRSATCKAMEPTEVFFLPREAFVRVLQKIPEVAIAVAQVLAERVENLNKERGTTMADISKFKFEPDIYKLVPDRILKVHKIINPNLLV